MAGLLKPAINFPYFLYFGLRQNSQKIVGVVCTFFRPCQRLRQRAFKRRSRPLFFIFFRCWPLKIVLLYLESDHRFLR